MRVALRVTTFVALSMLGSPFFESRVLGNRVWPYHQGATGEPRTSC